MSFEDYLVSGKTYIKKNQTKIHKQIRKQPANNAFSVLKMSVFYNEPFLIELLLLKVFFSAFLISLHFPSLKAM